MEVPQTPLHTSRVLQEEQDVWEEVKVNDFAYTKLPLNNEILALYLVCLLTQVLFCRH